MARDASKHGDLNRDLEARPLRSVNGKLVARWLVIALCLLFWLVILYAFVL